MEDNQITPMDIVEDYKKRISDLINEAEKAIGYPIGLVEIKSTKLALIKNAKLVERREITFNIKI